MSKFEASIIVKLFEKEKKMKKNLLTIAAIFVIAITFGETTYAQLGNILNKAKDAAKKKEKKIEPTIETNTQQNDKPNTAENMSSSSQVQTSLGKIYYSSQPFPEGGGTTGAKNSFSSNEFIYARLVLKGGTVKEVLKPSEPDKKIKEYNIDFLLYTIKDNNSISDLGRNFRAIINKSDLDKTYFDFDIFPSPDNAKSAFYWGGNPNDGISYGFDMYLFLTNSQTNEGTYKILNKIKIQAVDFRGNPLPENQTQSILDSFNITFSGSDYAKIKANQEKLNISFETNYKIQKAANEPVPAEWTAKSSPIISGYTTASITNLYINSFSTSASVLKVIKLYAAPAKAQGIWINQNNEFGIPSYRYSSQWFTAFVRDSSNGLCYYQGFGLRQNYSGGGTFGNVFVDHGNSAVLACDKLGMK